MKLLERLFPNRAEFDSLKAERNKLAEQNESLRLAEAAARQREREHYRREETLKTELRQTKEKLREQTDADLLLISQRITARILAGNKPERSDIAEHQRLMVQRQSLNAQLNIAGQQFGRSQNGALGLLGSGVFGFYP